MMSQSDLGDWNYPENTQLGEDIANAAEANNPERAEELIRAHEFIVLQQIDLETGEIEVDEEDQFSVVLAEVDEDLAVVCFSSYSAAENFMDTIGNDLTGGKRLPAVILDGNELLDGLPDSIGLLVNPATDSECYFMPQCFSSSEQSYGDDQDDDALFPEA